jgi:uncharacterized protein
MYTELRAGLDAVDPIRWNALAGADDPFVEHAFLRALETSGSVGAGSGWEPAHILAFDGNEIVGALPLYAKEHSWGEFIFDFAWARSAERAGIAYYPKLVSMAPFTPATGRHVLIAEGADPDRVTRVLIDGAKEAMRELRCSSLHLLFLNDEERSRAIACGMSPRLSVQFTWHNDGYRSFDDYLARFRSEKRKHVRRERAQVNEKSALEIAVKEGPSLTDREWKALARFYRLGVDRHGSYPYLRPSFFEAIRRTHASRVVAVFAYEDREPVAASLSFEKGSHLYGRYWGALDHVEFLHFELCYYRLIERAIERGHARFEAGAQGSHKLKRGMLASEIHSAHFMAHPMLRAAVDEYLPQEAAEMKAEIAIMNQHSPFKRD